MTLAFSRAAAFLNRCLRRPVPRPSRRFPRRSRRGLINVLLTVAVAAGVIIGILSIYNQVNTSISTSSAQSLLNSMEAEIRRAYASDPQYSGDIDEFIEAALPESALNIQGGNRVIVTPWGGRVTAGGGAAPGTDGTSPNRFWIRMNGLPERACESLANAYLGLSSVFAVRAGDNVTQSGSARTDADAVATGCDGDGDDQVAVVFRG